MKQLSILQKLVLAINVVFVIFLLACFVAPYIPADNVPFFSMLAMTTPFWLITNFIFVSYWLFIRKRYAIVSLATLTLSFFFLPSSFQISSTVKTNSEEDIKLMTFNTKDFGENKEQKIKEIVDFVNKEDPDIVCFQEFYYAMKRSSEFSQYPYRFIDFVYGEKSGRAIQAIYSKFPILKVDLIEFPSSANGAVYADLVVEEDTIRVYNVHLQSFNIIPAVSTIQKKDSRKLFNRIRKVVKLQKQQIKIVNNHREKSSYRTILMGDLNNTQFTNIYKSLKGDLQDSFMEVGSGFGKTFDLKGFPMRIDYIFADKNFEFTSHTNYDVKLSDHYPVMATLKLKTDETTVD